MSKKEKSVKKIAKKIALYLTIIVLTFAASALLGILSWAGMWVILPVLFVAAAAGFLSMIFEGEIYFQNIKGALLKLFKNEYLKKFFASKLFEAFFNSYKAGRSQYKSKFLRDYEICEHQLHIVNKNIREAAAYLRARNFSFEIFWLRVKKVLHLNITEPAELAALRELHGIQVKLKAYKQQRSYIEKNHKTFHKIFTRIVFTQKPSLNDYEQQLYDDFYNPPGDEAAGQDLPQDEKPGDTPQQQPQQPRPKQKSQQEYETLLKKRRQYYHVAKFLSFLSFAAVSFGTIYLLGGVLEMLPAAILLASPLLASPLVIIPLALIVGLAYGLLTYNAITDMLNHETIQKWWKIFFGGNPEDDAAKKKARWEKRALFLAGAILFSLAVALSVCTGGTWWTITQNVPAFLSWMNNIAPKLLVLIRALVWFITSVATGFFDIENTSETLEIVEKFLSGDLKKDAKKKLRAMWDEWRKESFWERWNPFRIILIPLLLVLQILLFVGHLVSIGVDADRVFNIPEVLSAILGTISEFFQDLHYFLKFMDEDDHADHHGHNHNLDLPTRILRIVLSPLCLAYIIWAHLAKPKAQAHALPVEKLIDVGISEESQAELALFRMHRFDNKNELQDNVGSAFENAENELLGLSNPWAGLGEAKAAPVLEEQKHEQEQVEVLVQMQMQEQKEEVPEQGLGLGLGLGLREREEPRQASIPDLLDEACRSARAEQAQALAQKNIDKGLKNLFGFFSSNCAYDARMAEKIDSTEELAQQIRASCAVVA